MKTNSFQFNNMEANFANPSAEMCGQIRYISKEQQFHIFSSIRETGKWVYDNDDSTNWFGLLIGDKEAVPNYLQFANKTAIRVHAYWNLCASEYENLKWKHTGYNVYYLAKLIGHPVYSGWFRDIVSAKSDAILKLKQIRQQKIEKQKKGRPYTYSEKWLPETRVSGKSWCVANKTKYNGTPKYETVKELRAGCNMICKRVCPQNAITFEPLRKDIYRLSPAVVEINHESCIQCGACIQACPNSNIVQHNIMSRHKVY